MAGRRAVFSLAAAGLWALKRRSEPLSAPHYDRRSSMDEIIATLRELVDGLRGLLDQAGQVRELLDQAISAIRDRLGR